VTDQPPDQRIPITDPDHLISLGITLGLVTALQVLDDIEFGDKLTGVGVAKYAIRAAEAEHRVQLMQKNIRLAVANGVDLDKSSICWDGKRYVTIEQKDLVELAETAPPQGAPSR